MSQETKEELKAQGYNVTPITAVKSINWTVVISVLTFIFYIGVYFNQVTGIERRLSELEYKQNKEQQIVNERATLLFNELRTNMKQLMKHNGLEYQKFEDVP